MQKHIQRKRISTFIMAAILICTAVVMCSCGSASNEGSGEFTGEWEMKWIEASGTQVDAKAYMRSADVDRVPVLSFEGDNKIIMETDSDTGEATWQKTEDGYVIHSYDSRNQPVDLPFTFDGQFIQLKQQGYTLGFEQR